MPWNSKCVGSTYDKDYSGGIKFTTDSMPGHLTDAGHAEGINPATLATIASIESLSEYGSKATTVSCEPCNQYGSGVCQVGKEMFDNWNAANGGEYKWCDDICGENYPNNLAICARYLRAAFDKLKDLGYTNDIQMMAMVATSWNGRYCGYDSDSAFFPFEGQTGYYLPRSNQLTGYGSTAGYLFKNSEYVGDGVFDDTVELE